MYTRRDFIKTSAALSVLGMLPAGLSCTSSLKDKKIGIQLYSVFETINDDFDGTIQRLLAIGYKRFENFGYRDGKFFGKTPKEMKAYLAERGAQMTSAHTGMRFPEEGESTPEQWDAWKRNCADTAEVGSSWIIQAGYPSRQIKGIADVYRLADQFNKCGEIAKSNNLMFAFHNHDEEFTALEGEIPYDVLLKNTDKDLVAYQVDTGHMHNGGGNFVEYIRKYPGRFSNFHLREVDNTGEGTELGKGITDFSAIFALADMAGLKDYYIEHAQATVDNLKNNYDFLMNAPYIKW